MSVAILDSSASKEGGVVERYSPATGKLVSRVATDDSHDCQRIAARAAAAFPAWSALSASRRAEYLQSLADTLLQMSPELCLAMQAEIGATVAWAEHNVNFAASLLREMARYAEQLDSPEWVSDDDSAAGKVERVPCGVCLGIVPWNAPIILGVRSIAAPLLCGNTVLLKGNELAPHTFRLLASALHESALPKDVAQVFICPPQECEAIVEQLIAQPIVRRVNFTGSTRVGRGLAVSCAQHLKRALLELGGQAPMVILEDADLEAATRAAIEGAYLNQGQICMSTERLIVADSVADALIRRLEQARQALTLGDPLLGNVDLGPVIDTAAAERLSGLLSDALLKGARLVGGGHAKDAFFEPTLLDGVEPRMRLYREEVFGPILSITRVHSDEEAISVANDSEYGLAAAVFSGNLSRAEAVSRQIHTGICHINKSTVGDDPHAPFGGLKASGYGRFGGRWALDEFTEARWLTPDSEQ